jgi:hypothetical protein
VTYEAVGRLAAANRFTRVVWASAKNSVFRTDTTQASGGVVDWLDVARLVAEQLDCELGPNRRHPTHRCWQETTTSIPIR